MPHTFPPKRFRDGEPLDPDAFNETFQEIAGKLAGRLNEQDIDADSLKNDVSVAQEAYYAVHSVEKATDPNLEDATLVDPWMAPAIATPTGDPISVIDDNPNWEALTDDGSTDTLSVTFTSSDDTVVIFAQAQHFAWVYDDPSSAQEPSSTVRLQYAIQMDGIVLDNSVTGAFFVPDQPAMHWYRANRVEDDGTGSPGADSDWRHILLMQNTVGINNAANATRLICATDVQDGEHTVSLVAKRLARSDFKIDEDGTGLSVAAFNRRLFVIRIKSKAPYTGGAPTIAISAVDDGETITLGNVFTNSLEAARQTTNSLTVGNISRGALRNEHLPSVVYGADVAYIQPGSSVPQGCGPYPGYGVDSVDWVTVNDGLGNELKINGPVGGWRLDNNSGTLIVLANVQAWLMRYSAIASEDVRACAVFTLAFTNSLGVRTLVASTEVVVNAHNPSPTSGADTHEPIGDDVPLMWLVDSGDLSADDRRIQKIEVLVTYWDGTGNADAIDVKTQRGSIHAFVLKGVHPS